MKPNIISLCIAGMSLQIIICDFYTSKSFKFSFV